MPRDRKRFQQRCISLTMEEDKAAKILIKRRILSKVCGEAILAAVKELPDELSGSVSNK